MKCPAMLFMALPALMASPRLACGQLLDAKVISLDAARTMAAAAEAVAKSRSLGRQGANRRPVPAADQGPG